MGVFKRGNNLDFSSFIFQKSLLIDNVLVLKSSIQLDGFIEEAKSKFSNHLSPLMIGR